jgi:hypothetical protein
VPTYAGITNTPTVDGTVYASQVPLTATEADLYSGATLPNSRDPVSMLYGQAVQAVVQLSVSGAPGGNSTYVVMQTDLGDGVWIDVAWCFWNGTQGNATFILCGGVAGNNAFQQSRQAGAVPTPQANGSNAMALGGRIRFVGRSSLSGGSSYIAGGFAGVKATITYKVLGLK